MLMFIICLACLLCCAVSVVTSIKTNRENAQIKRESLSTRSQYIRLESQFNDLTSMVHELSSISHNLVAEVQALKDVTYQQAETIERLEYDNRVIKRKLKIHDTISMHSNVVQSFRTSI